MKVINFISEDIEDIVHGAKQQGRLPVVLKKIHDDLISIGNNGGFLGKNREKTFAQGEEINNYGGIRAMQFMYYYLYFSNEIKPLVVREIEHAWDEVGEWRA